MSDRIETYTRMYQPPEWFDAQEALDLTTWYPEAGRLMQVYEVAGAITVAERAGLMPADAKHIFEFGSGAGAGLIALNMFARSSRTEAEVIGSEITAEDRRVCLMVSEALDKVVDIIPNGYSGLEQEGSLDFVLAFMFGPDYDSAKKAAKFIPRALASLTENGTLLINSDETTMENIHDWVKDNIPKSQFRYLVDGDLPTGFIAMPHLIIRK